jgi:hypothetical protein
MGAEHAPLASFPCQAVAIGLRWLIASRAGRAVRVIVLPPGVDRPAGLCRAETPRLMHAVVPKLPVATLAGGVLDRLARLNEVQRHAAWRLYRGLRLS